MVPPKNPIEFKTPYQIFTYYVHRFAMDEQWALWGRKEAR